MDNLISDLQPEEKLLLILCRLSFTDEHKSKLIELLPELVNHDLFVWLANEHGIVSSVFHNLQQQGLSTLLPGNIKSSLQELYLKSLARNTFLTGKFVELKNTLAEIGIEPVVLKGMALEHSVYGNAGLRQMNDIDIYTEDKNECLMAWNHLQARGYQARPLKSPLYNKILPDFGKHLPDLYKDGVSFDLHYSLFENEYPVKSLAVSTEKTDLLIPDYDIHFLYLVKHLHDHELAGGSQLRLYLDLVQLMLMPGEKTGAGHLMSLAGELDMVDILREKLYLLKMFWSVPVDDAVLDELSAVQKAKATDEFLAFLHKPKGNTGRHRGAIYRKTLRNIPTLRRKIIFILGDIFPSVSFMQTRYKTRTRTGACLYYPLRLSKLLLLLKR